jgi:predicted nucleic acid-binding protein
MTAKFFVDTNILLYSIDDDPASAAKRTRAEQLLLAEDQRTSLLAIPRRHS